MLFDGTNSMLEGIGSDDYWQLGIVVRQEHIGTEHRFQPAER